MKIEIFDVEHGQCVLVTADGGNQMLIDSGHNDTTGWRPSSMLAERGITYLETFIVSNCDEDHISDLVGVTNWLLTADRSSINVDYLGHNFDLTPELIRQMKAPNPLTNDMKVLCALIPKFKYIGGQGFGLSRTFGPPTCVSFNNRYPHHLSDPTEQGFSNNMSFVTFLHSGDIHIIFSGDLEPKGWGMLVADDGFRRELETVNVFVAPHHGRSTGYLAEVFDKFCAPKVIIISDGMVQYNTQSGVYGSAQASGITMWPIGGNYLQTGNARYVLTTRNDTTKELPAIKIQQLPGQTATIMTAREVGTL